MSYIVQPDSVLASTAAALLVRHSAGPGSGGLCPSCGWPAPCPTAQHADLVLAATPAAAPAAAGASLPIAA